MDKRLQDNLQNVQQDYIAPFLWLHNENDSDILSEIQHVWDSGIRSICLESRIHPEFCRQDWWDDIKLIFQECKKRGMKVWILDEKNYPSGHGNGCFKEKYKELRPWGITECHMDVAGPVTEGGAMADCWLEREGDEILAVLAAKHVPNCEKYSEVLDITDGLKGNMVYFTLPEGMWRIIFLIKTQRGYYKHRLWHGDKLNYLATEKIIEEIYQPHYDRFSEYFGSTFLGFFSDEPSFGNDTATNPSFEIKLGEAFRHHPWSNRVYERMQEIYGEDVNRAMTGLWFDVEGVAEEVRYRFMDIISDEYRKNYSGVLADWCHEHGVKYIGHIIEDNNCHCMTKSGPAHYFRALDGQDMSGIDVVLNQLIPGLTECSNTGFVAHNHMQSDFFHYVLGKLASSFAHIDPKKKGRAMCEIFGAYGWAEGTKIMKYLTDHMLVRGINYFVPHAFSPKPNDTDCPPNFYDTGNNPQYKFFKNTMEYMNRMSHMLNDGVHISSCAILYDAGSKWMNKGLLPMEQVAKVLYDHHLDYDIIPLDYLDQIQEGKLQGENYNVLILPYVEHIPTEIMHKLQNADIKVITVSEKEWNSGFENVLLADLVDYLNGHYGCDVSTDYQGIYLRHYHYSRNDAQIYMFTNEGTYETIETTVRLSAFSGGKYIVYDAFENKAVSCVSDTGEIRLSLPPYNSIVILCGDVSFEGVEEAKEMQLLSEKELDLSYDIIVARSNSESFVPFKRASGLCNITSAENLPDFSGHIRYDAEFELESAKTLELDLGNVGEVAELYINQKYLGSRQFPPYSFDISQYVTVGKNRMRIIVSNHNGYERRDCFSKFMLFEPSGLLGPVKMRELGEK